MPTRLDNPALAHVPDRGVPVALRTEAIPVRGFSLFVVALVGPVAALRMVVPHVAAAATAIHERQERSLAFGETGVRVGGRMWVHKCESHERRARRLGYGSAGLREPDFNRFRRSHAGQITPSDGTDVTRKPSVGHASQSGWWCQVAELSSRRYTPDEVVSNGYVARAALRNPGLAEEGGTEEGIGRTGERAGLWNVCETIVGPCLLMQSRSTRPKGRIPDFWVGAIR